MLALMRQSPLQKKLRRYLRCAGYPGRCPARLTLHLLLPLKHELGETRVDGDIQFAQASLSDKRWGLAFTDVNGRVHYDQTGVLADGLNVKLKGDPATFRLAIGQSHRR